MAWSEEMAKQYPNDNARPHPGPRLTPDPSPHLMQRGEPQERENGSRRLAQSDASEKFSGRNTNLPLPEGEGRGEGIAWPESRKTSELWKPARFVGSWDLLAARAETQVDFLQSLDLFVYDLREDCSESWGRAVVEAMLTGAVPLVPGHPRHHLRNIVPHGVGGFLCSTNDEWREHAQRLQADDALRKKMAKAAREFAVEELCNAAKHRAAWREVFEG